HTGSLALAQDLARHDLTLKIGGGFVANQIGRAKDALFRRSLLVGSGSVGLAGTPGPDDLVDLGYSASYLSGYQASPYRFVALHVPGAVGPALGRPETVPGTRLRHAVTLRWNHHMFTDTALRSHVRG